MCLPLEFRCPVIIFYILPYLVHIFKVSDKLQKNQKEHKDNNKKVYEKILNPFQLGQKELGNGTAARVWACV